MSGPITHIVCFKYRSDITWSDFEKHFEQFMGLKTKSLNPKTGKPLIKSMKAGKLLIYPALSPRITYRSP